VAAAWPPDALVTSFAVTTRRTSLVTSAAAPPGDGALLVTMAAFAAW